MKLKLISFCLVALPGLAHAQGAPSEDVQVPGGALMLVSYLVLWALLLGYLAYLARRQGLIEDDLEVLRKRMDDMLGLED